MAPMPSETARPSDLTDFLHDSHEQHRSRDRALAEIAGKQHGVISRAQLEALGFGRGTIDHRRVMSRLHTVHRGVYAVGHERLTGRGRWMAAVLACGHGAVLSHRPGGGLWGIVRSESALIHVTVPRRKLHSRRGIRVHAVRSRHPDDVTVRDGIPVTSLARTLLDMAETEPPNQLRRALDQAERLQVLDLFALTSLCARSRGHRGLKPLRAQLEERAGPPPITRSEFEEMFIDFVHEFDLERPVMNVSVLGYEVDALWRQHRLIIELDSRSFHDNPAAFEEDRARDMRLQVAGYRVLRITYRRLLDHPEAVAAAIRALLDPRPSTARASPSPHERSC
jgi:very-short-patch-repair endonuclease